MDQALYKWTLCGRFEEGLKLMNANPIVSGSVQPSLKIRGLMNAMIVQMPLALFDVHWTMIA